MFNRTGRAQCPERLSVSIYRLLPRAPHASTSPLRNAVAMRGHIKPVMVPFSSAITRRVVISLGYLASSPERESQRLHGHFFRRRPYRLIVSIPPARIPHLRIIPSATSSRHPVPGNLRFNSHAPPAFIAEFFQSLG